MSEGSNLSFIVSDEEYDPLDPYQKIINNKNYVFKSSSSEDIEEAGFDQIDYEEKISAIIGQ